MSKNLMLEEGKAGSPVSAGGKLVSQKEISYSSDKLSDHLVGWTGGEGGSDQGGGYSLTRAA